MFSRFNVSSDFMDYDQKNNINDNNNLVIQPEKQGPRAQGVTSVTVQDAPKGANYWKMPRLRLNSFLELDQSHNHQVDLYSDLWYCSSCGHLKPICIEQLFAFLSPFIPLNDIPIISEMTWCHIANVRKISQVTILAIELDIKDDLMESPKDKFGSKDVCSKSIGSEEGECSSDSNDNNKAGELQMHATTIKSSNVLLATHFPLYASNLLPPKVESNKKTGSTNNLVDSPILLPFLPPAGGSISFDQHLLSLHEQICLTSPNIIGQKVKLSESSSSHSKPSPFVYINKLKNLNAGETNSYHPCTSQWDTFARTKLLANRQTLAEEGYPLPPKVNGKEATINNGGLNDDKDQECNSFVFSQPMGYAPVSAQLSPLLAIDCEMCIVRGGGRALVRVTVVNEALETIYDSLVKPEEPITDYLTRYSGVDEDILKGVSVRLADVQKDLSDILKLASTTLSPSPNTKAAVILCGHSLNFDLEALKVYHPYVVDTSMIYNISGVRHHKAKLKTLAQAFLGKIIQKNGSAGHDSAEDAATVMELVLLKLRTGINFGDFTKSKRGHKLILPKPVNKSGPLSKVNGHKLPDFNDSYVNCCPACYPALVKVVENDRLCSSYRSATDYSEEQENYPIGLPRLPVDKNQLSRQKNKTWQILLTRPACDIKVDSDSVKSLSRLHFFPDTSTLLRHHKYHALDRYVTVSSVRVEVGGDSMKNSKLREITQEIDQNLSDLYQSAPENSLHIVLVWPKIEKDSPPNVTNEANSPSAPCITNQFGSVWVKMKR